MFLVWPHFPTNFGSNAPEQWGAAKLETKTMSEISVTRIINAPIGRVWDAWDDFGAVSRFSPEISRSEHVSGTPETGLGAERHCEMLNGRFMRERITEYDAPRRMKVEVVDCNLPIRDVTVTFDLHERAVDETEITMTMTFRPKNRFFGALMISSMRRTIAEGLGRLLVSNKRYVETGQDMRHAPLFAD